MRSLEQSLLEHELLTLRAIGEWWEIELTGLDKNQAVKVVAEKLSEVDIGQEILFLPEEEAAALQDLIAQGGRAPVAAFVRKHGEIRLMGPGRLEREEPWLYPVSPAEALWYRGFLYRGFDETAEGLIEFYYIPSELLNSLPAAAEPLPSEAQFPIPHLEDEPQQRLPAVTDAVDDLTALLAVALQLTQDKDKRPDLDRLLLNPDPERRSMLLTLAHDLGLVRRGEGKIRPTRTAVTWLKQSRDAQLLSLADAWSKTDWNDLCHTPGLVCEGENWQNEPILARTALLDALGRADRWYRLIDLVNFLKVNNPDFQRPDGNYDTWYIREDTGESYLTGFDSWDLVEGQLIKFIIKGPLYWLGMVELGDVNHPEKEAFRLMPRAFSWLAGDIEGQAEPFEPIQIKPDGAVWVSRHADRYIRFQVARISEALDLVSGKPFQYQITPGSLAKAQDQGIRADRIIQFLKQATGDPLPKSVERGIMRWSENGVEGRLENVVILRVRDEQILETLRTNPRTRDFLGEMLGKLAVAVKPGQEEKLRLATAQLGLLLELEL